VWRSLEKDFRNIPDTFGGLRADWSHQPEIPNHWNITGGFSPGIRDRFEAVAKLAGNRLLVSPAARSMVPQEVLAEADPLTRWLTALREVSGHFEARSTYCDDNGRHVFTGRVNRVIEASALLCLQLAAEDLSDSVAPSAAGRVFVDDIDSFAKVRQVDPKEVRCLLANGRLDVGEDEVQRCIEAVLDVPLHKSDWGGEENDLYTTNLILDGRRVPTAFALKGRGLGATTLHLARCGRNGDQIVRLFQSPAELFVVQFVGMVSESVVKDMEGKVRGLASQGRSARFCVIDGQDTARLLRAYGNR
jgi:hypothetical protein